MLPMQRFLRKRVWFLCLLLSLASTLWVPFVAADDQADLEATVRSYFGLRYSILAELEMDETIRDFFSPDVLNLPNALSEVDRLSALVAYRQAQSNDLRFNEAAEWDLRFLSFQQSGSRGELIVEESYEYYFVTAPTVPNRGEITHVLTLDNRSGSWKIIRDEYVDADGFNKMLDDIFAEAEVSKEQALEQIVGRAQAADTAWNSRFSQLMSPYPGVLVFMRGQSHAWIDGQVQRLDELNTVAPSFYGEQLYLPLRSIVEKMGGEVAWSAETGMIEASYQGKVLSFVNLGTQVLIDDAVHELERSIPLLMDRTMIPAALVAELLQRSLYLDSSGVAVLSAEALSAEQQADLHAALNSLYLARFSSADFPNVDGSTATYPLTVAFGKRLLGLDDTSVRGLLTHNTTHNAYVNLLEKKADIIFVTPPSDEELTMAKEAGIELEVVPICKEGFVFLVNEENPVLSLSQEQIVDIYQGQVANWQDVGGEDLALVAYQREPNSGSQTLMELAVMQGRPLMTPPKEYLVMGMGPLIDRVADYSNARGALGYSVYYYATSMYASRAVRLLAVDEVEPNFDTIRSEEYPYTVRYYAVLRKDEPENSSARRLLSWLLAEEGQQVAVEAGFVPLA